MSLYKVGVTDSERLDGAAGAYTSRDSTKTVSFLAFASQKYFVIALQ